MQLVRERIRREQIIEVEHRLLFVLDAIIPCDLSVALRYGILAAALDRAGTRIPRPDLWIAATALVHGCIIVSADGHFDRVPNLARVDWSVP